MQKLFYFALLWVVLLSSQAYAAKAKKIEASYFAGSFELVLSPTKKKGCDVVLYGSPKKKKVLKKKNSTKLAVLQLAKFKSKLVFSFDQEIFSKLKTQRKFHFMASYKCGKNSLETPLSSVVIPASELGMKVSDFHSALKAVIENRLELQLAYDIQQLSLPVDLQSHSSLPDSIFVASHLGLIYKIDKGETDTLSTVLNMQEQVQFGGEAGLIGIALHPNFDQNGELFVNYVVKDTTTSRLSRLIALDPANPQFDIMSEQIILEIDRAENYHYGGQIIFGPDGYLYMSIGDGGPQGDPKNVAQDLSNLLGTIIRIDVDQTQGNLAYAIPSDNPFTGQEGDIRAEIYAFGFRNPWRMSFDPGTDQLWLGDVGLGDREEIDIVTAGANYGWGILEGTKCRTVKEECKEGDFVAPQVEYPHTMGSSVTGGAVYRGEVRPDLFGQYLFADFINGDLWALNPGTKQLTLMGATGINPSAFGTDSNGELYILDYSNGQIWSFAE